MSTLLHNPYRIKWSMKGEGVEKVQKTVYVVYEGPLMSTFETPSPLFFYVEKLWPLRLYFFCFSVELGIKWLEYKHTMKAADWDS